MEEKDMFEESSRAVKDIQPAEMRKICPMKIRDWLKIPKRQK
jgi:hypothetical protein